MSTLGRRLIVVVPLALGCTADLPGEVVGTFRVTVALRENSCGAGAVYGNDGRKYEAELREDEAKKRAYWHVPKSPPLEGTADGDSFRFAYQSIVANETTDGGVGCQLVQSEVLEGNFERLDAGAADDAGDAAGADEDTAGDAADAGVDADGEDAGQAFPLEATHTLTIEAAAGASCVNAVMPIGAFIKLPCTVTYDLTGTRRRPL